MSSTFHSLVVFNTHYLVLHQSQFTQEQMLVLVVGNNNTELSDRVTDLLLEIALLCVILYTDKGF